MVCGLTKGLSYLPKEQTTQVFNFIGSHEVFIPLMVQHSMCQVIGVLSFCQAMKRAHMHKSQIPLQINLFNVVRMKSVNGTI